MNPPEHEDDWMSEDPTDDRQEPNVRDDLTKLRKAIYDYDDCSTNENAEILATLTDYCNMQYGKKATKAEISAALLMLRKRNRS